MPGTTVQRGNVLSTWVMSVSLTPVSVGATTVAEQAFTVMGLNPNTDQISAVLYNGGAWTNLTSIVSYRVSLANTLAVSFQNGTAGALTPPGGQYYLEVNRTEFAPLPVNMA